MRLSPLSALVILATSVALTACNALVPRRIDAARYVSEGDEGIEIVVDRGARKLTLRKGDEIIERAYSTVDQDQWPIHCRANMTADRLETFTLDGGPLTIGAHTYQTPILSADCGSSGRVLLTVPTPDGYGQHEGAVILSPAK